MFADPIDTARLWAFVSGFLDEPHLGTDVETVKFSVYDAVAVKIDFATGAVGDHAVVVRRIESGDLPVRWHVVRLHLATFLAYVILKLTSSCFECITDGHVNIVMRMMFTSGVTHDDFAAGRTYVDGYMVDIAFVVVLVRCLDGHSTTYDFAIEVLELLNPPANGCLDGGGRAKIAEL